MIRDKREARGAIKLSGGGSQPLPDRDQWNQESSAGGLWEDSPQGQNATGIRAPWPPTGTGRAIEMPEGER